MTTNKPILKPVKVLSRYTSLPVLLDLLQRKKLVLLDPKLWEDKNDAEVILEYKKKKEIRNLFCLCFSCGDETVHHWKTYANGPSGCVIEFDAARLFALLDRVEGVKHRKVEYKKLSEIESRQGALDVDKMPFTKRWPYRCEEEYRVIAELSSASDFFEIDVPLELIRKITISQQMPEQIYTTIKSYLREATKNPESRISRSTLYQNTRWINRV